MKESGDGMEPEQAIRPDTIDTDDPLQPMGPWSFLRQAIPGGFSSWGLQLMLAWVSFEALTSAAWAFHLRKLVGSSALPSYWGELLTVRDLWELAINGGLKAHPTGFWTPLAAVLAIVWVLWSGWRLQSHSVALHGRCGQWFWGAIDALIIGGAPLLVLGLGISWILDAMASTGHPGLNWLNLVGGTFLLRLSCISALMLQWWLCRIDRAQHPVNAWHLGGIEILGRHLAQSFLRLWRHPVQWVFIIVGGVIARAGLHLLVMLLAWYLGGSSVIRVWMFLGLELFVTALNAWLLGWFLRTSALYWRHDDRVRQEIRSLEEAMEG
jgi:hypothetical protein